MQKPNISFFFPAFYDEGTIIEMVEEAREVLAEVTTNYEVIIVNDGSLDETGDIADQMSEKYPEVKAIHHQFNLGYGAALKTGFAACQYDWIFYTDGDHQFDIHELKDLLPYINDYDMIAGYRKTRAYDNKKIRSFTSSIYNIFIKLIFGLKYKDLDCAFKLMKRDVVRNSKDFIDSAFICAILFFEAKKNGHKIKQIPVSHYQRKYGSSSSFSFLFIIKSIVELFEAIWNVKYREKVYLKRQKTMLKKLDKK
ncbi:MAG: glycosyltransferase family 2 protein [bacterium]|nr:glycosyltransferase family 2 protein [bacterium]